MFDSLAETIRNLHQFFIYIYNIVKLIRFGYLYTKSILLQLHFRNIWKSFLKLTVISEIEKIVGYIKEYIRSSGEPCVSYTQLVSLSVELVSWIFISAVENKIWDLVFSPAGPDHKVDRGGGIIIITTPKHSYESYGIDLNAANLFTEQIGIELLYRFPAVEELNCLLPVQTSISNRLPVFLDNLKFFKHNFSFFILLRFLKSPFVFPT